VISVLGSQRQILVRAPPEQQVSKFLLNLIIAVSLEIKIARSPSGTVYLILTVIGFFFLT